MVQDNKNTINRRRMLQGVGGVGIAAVAGCTGDDDGDGSADDSGGNGNGNGDHDVMDVRLEVNADNADRVQMVELIAAAMEDSGYFNTEIETYEWNTYLARVLDTEYADNGYLPCIGLSGTFNPESFCQALHHSTNHGQCCNLTGISDPELDDMLDDARYGVDVAGDPDLRAERYDEIWKYLAENRYSSITHFDISAGVTSNRVHNFEMYPFSESIFSYNVYSPADEHVAWLDEDSDPSETGLSDIQTGGTLRGGIAANIASFDPPYSSDTTSTMAQGFIFEQLITNDSEGNLYPWLAEDYELLETNDIERIDYEDYMITVDADEEGALDTAEQIIVRHPENDPEADDEARVLTPAEAADAVADGVFGMQYRYYLEEGVEFHNGQEMTAEDVVASYERYENSDVAAQTYDSVLHVEEIDEYTVDIYAQIPDAEAERELPGVYIMTAEQAALDNGDIDPRQGNDPIGTGAYEFSEFVDEQYVVYTKFDDYWVEQKGIDSKDWFDGPSNFPDGPVIDELDLEIVPDDATRSGAIQNGEIDMTYGLETGTLDDFDASDDFIVDGVEAGGYEYIQYPMHVEPWDDDRLRRAVNHLIPRQQIVDNVLNGWGRPAWTDIPELAMGTGTVDADAIEDEIRPYNEYDPERAGELLEEFFADRA